MRTIITGRVEQSDLFDAELLAGIVPTSFITNGDWSPPASQLPTDVMPPCPKVPGELGIRQRNYTMGLAADAVIIGFDGDRHLLEIARSYKLPVYEVPHG